MLEAQDSNRTHWAALRQALVNLTNCFSRTRRPRHYTNSSFNNNNKTLIKVGSVKVNQWAAEAASINNFLIMSLLNVQISVSKLLKYQVC